MYCVKCLRQTCTTVKITFSVCTHGWKYKMCLRVEEQLTPSCTVTKMQRVIGHISTRQAVKEVLHTSMKAPHDLFESQNESCCAAFVVRLRRKWRRHTGAEYGGSALRISSYSCLPIGSSRKFNLTVTLAALASSLPSRWCTAAMQLSLRRPPSGSFRLCSPGMMVSDLIPRLNDATRSPSISSLCACAVFLAGERRNRPQSWIYLLNRVECNRCHFYHMF